MAGMSEAVPPISAAVVDPLQMGRDALNRHAWPEAFELLSQADREIQLSAVDLEAFALAAFFAAHAEVELEVKERAFKAHEAESNNLRAAYLALDVARAYGHTGKPSIAWAWTRRAEQTIGPDGETYAHGYLALLRSEGAAATGDMETALALAERAVAIGTGAADADLKAYALTNLGALKIASGATSDGLALMEEASIAAVNGDLSPFTSGVTSCRMIGACRDLTDYRRASEWIEATERYCDRQSLSGFPGVCRLLPAQVEIAIAAGDVAGARTGVDELTEIVAGYPSPALEAGRQVALGRVLVAEGDPTAAARELRSAIKGWREVGAPYEVARARAVL